MHAALRHIVTLATALLAGGIALYPRVPTSAGVKGAALALLFVALVAAFRGWQPMRAFFDPDDPGSIREARKRLAARKSRSLHAAALALALALGVLVAGVILWPQ